MSVLHELFYGNIRPNDKHFEHDSQCAKFSKIISENRQNLIDFLRGIGAEEELHMLSQMINAQNEINCFSECEYFIEGFRLGSEVILDTFVTPQKNVLKDIN